ncbi:Ankyrin-1 [Dactylellina cionopaga]|nr:Ankyrin-1 [Dactylellina cionopaga]
MEASETSTARTARTHDEYTVGWVCALPKESVVAVAMLDQRHEDLPNPPKDDNSYTLGSIGKHNIVIACLPKGMVGTVSAAVVAVRMATSFPNIKFGLMVGVGGGVPQKGKVRLGDIVISTPAGQFPGVVQWDFGKATATAQGSTIFERTGALNNPPKLMLTALAKMEAEQELHGSKVPEYLDELKRKFPRLAAKYLRSELLVDVLFKANCNHINNDIKGEEGEEEGEDEDEDDEEETCKYCDKSKVVKRKARTDMQVHYGLIASGNQVIQDALLRDNLNKEFGGSILCIETEAAGLLNDFPCLVIRGISDYADSHSNIIWQEHAAAAAAALAKELLGYVSATDVERARPAREIARSRFPSSVPSSSSSKFLIILVGDIVSRIEVEVKKAASLLDKQEDLKILNWLTPIDYRSQQTDYIRRRQAGTGNWLLESTEFQRWVNSGDQTLFCPGIPGAGKTIITAVVVDHIQRFYMSDKSVEIAYLYFNFKRHDEQKLQDTFASLLRQLIQNQPQIPESVKILYNNYRISQPPLEEILKALLSVASLYSRVFIIIDALDECQVSEGCRAHFLSKISNFRVTSGASLFATSRFIPEITNHFKEEKSMELEVRASNEDIQRYLENTLPRIEGIVKNNRDLHEEIKDSILSSVNGREVDVYDGTYNEAMKRIQLGHSSAHAMKVLAWITFAKRQLTTSELQYALAVEIGKSEFDKDNLPDLDCIISICIGLVTIDEESNTIRLVHYTTQNFLERTWSNWFPSVHTDITKTCITYLSYTIFTIGPSQTADDFRARLHLNPLYEYAARNWGHHAQASGDGTELVLGFLKNDMIISACCQALVTDVKSDSLMYRREPPKNVLGVHLAGYFGLQESMRALILNTANLNVKDSHKHTPLSWAASEGHKAVAKLLVEQGADIETKDIDERTPLSWAATRGHTAMVKLLIEQSADIETRDIDGQTPLFCAALNGHEAVVKLLMERSADIETKDIHGRTPLFWAAEIGQKAVVKLLVEEGADTEIKDFNGQTPLSWAARSGQNVVVKLLMEKGADIETKDIHGRTPLSWAAANGQTAVVKQLTEEGADIETEDSNGQTPLSWATRSGQNIVAKLLMEQGADIETKDIYGRTPLSWAAMRGHGATVKLLIEQSADTKTKDINDQTPFFCAALNGHEAVAKLLIEQGAEQRQL